MFHVPWPMAAETTIRTKGSNHDSGHQSREAGLHAGFQEPGHRGRQRLQGGWIQALLLREHHDASGAEEYGGALNQNPCVSLEYKVHISDMHVSDMRNM